VHIKGALALDSWRDPRAFETKLLQTKR
jgi:hypothetical protein